jgi:hypothetical protein
MTIVDRPRPDVLTPEQQREALRLFVQAAFLASLDPKIRAGIAVADRVMRTTPMKREQKPVDQVT